jgi:hypothetical protein
MRVAVLGFVLVAACAPTVDGPAEHARAIDRRDADALEARLAALPGATSAHVVVHRPFRDPLVAAATPTPASAAILVVADARADHAAIAAAAARLAPAEIARPEIAVMTAPHVVAARPRLWIALLAAIALIAGAIAWRARPRRT